MANGNGYLQQVEHTILTALKKSPESTVYALEKATGIDRASVKYWLGKLVDKELVLRAQEGKATYSVNSDNLKFTEGTKVLFIKAGDTIHIYADEKSGIGNLFNDPSNLSPINTLINTPDEDALFSTPTGGTPSLLELYDYKKGTLTKEVISSYLNQSAETTVKKYYESKNFVVVDCGVNWRGGSETRNTALKYLKDKYAFDRVLVSQKGAPDFLIYPKDQKFDLYPPSFVEVKSTGDSLRRSQIDWLTRSKDVSVTIVYVSSQNSIIKASSISNAAIRKILISLIKKPNSTIYHIEKDTDVDKTSVKHWLEKLLKNKLITKDFDTQSKKVSYSVNRKNVGSTEKNKVVAIRVEDGIQVFACEGTTYWSLFNEYIMKQEQKGN